MVSVGSVSARGPRIPAFEHLETVWSNVSDYTMTIDAHEVLGDVSADNQIHYAFERPDRARMDVLAGKAVGSTVFLDHTGPETVTAYLRAFPLFRKHGEARDKDLTSLRGNSILMLNVSTLIACFGQHASELKQVDGPIVDGEPTDEVELPYANVSCDADAPGDRGVVTLDTLDIARDTGYIVERKRYVGNEVVERWQIGDYKINSGLTPEDLS